MRHRTSALEWVQGKARESVIKLLVQLTICNYTCQGIKQIGFSLHGRASDFVLSLIRLQAELGFI